LHAEPEAAVPLLREAEALFRELGQQEDVVWTLWFLGNTAQLQGDYDRAEELYAQALTLMRDLRHPSTVAQAIAMETGGANLLTSLGSVAFLRGDLGRADACLREAVLLCSRVASADLLAPCVLHLAGVALGRGHTTRAARLVGAAEGLWGAVESGIMPVYRAIYDRICAELSRGLGEGTFALDRAHGRRMSQSELTAYALAANE
jgi:tetratricopeptide (TPR) repeat protein